MYGRLSDIFGRKITLQVAVALLVLGDLLCSIANTAIQLYAFRALSGIGGGGITNIAMVIVSDIVPLKERGKYQGFISAACSLGNAIGPFVGGGFASSGQWRWLFRTISFSGVLAAIIIHIIVPLKPVDGSVMAKVRMIDYAGILLSSAGTIFLLIPISGGGSTFDWTSSTCLGLLISGVLCLVAFVVVEAWFARLPILPRKSFALNFVDVRANMLEVRLFTMWTPTVVMIISFLIGMIYYGVSGTYRIQAARLQLTITLTEHLLRPNLYAVRARLQRARDRGTRTRIHTSTSRMGHRSGLLCVGDQSLQARHCKSCRLDRSLQSEMC